MRRIAFIDATSTAPYDAQTAKKGGLGGTEATVARVATALAPTFDVVVAQSRRKRASADGQVRWLPYDFRDPDPRILEADAIVVVRSDKILPRLARQNPQAALFLWMHCVPGRKRKTIPRMAVEHDVTLVAVSEHHRRRLREYARARCPEVAPRLRIEVVHNPIEPSLQPRPHVQPDTDTLLFTSSPHKGLDQVVGHFERLRRAIPSVRLKIANPGYLDWHVPGIRQPGIEFLGSLPHHEVVGHLRRSFCLFYPQHTFEETFGLVLAEANAVGTPALAHPLGAAPEVLCSDPTQLVDATDPEAVLETIARWRRDGRPRVRLPPRFRLPRVAARWAHLLGGSQASRDDSPKHDRNERDEEAFALGA